MLLIIVSLTVTLAVAQGPERFVVRDNVPVQGLRFDPNPKWVHVDWLTKPNQQLIPIRKAIDAVLARPPSNADAKIWREKLSAAYKDWFEDHQNGQKLFRISSILGVVSYLDREYAGSTEYRKMASDVNLGWSFLDKPIPAYEFVRRGYILNAGDGHHHKFGNLQQRLLKENPLDRPVILAMIGEYSWRKPIPSFENLLFGSLSKVTKTSVWKPVDNLSLAWAYRLRGQKHRNRADYDLAIKIVKGVRATHPNLISAKDANEWIEESEREMKDPNFGIIPSGSYIDDKYP